MNTNNDKTAKTFNSLHPEYYYSYSRLKEIRKSYKLTQKEFANRLGINASTYSSYERDKSEIPEKVIRRLLHSFKINLNWFFSGKGNCFTEEYLLNHEQRRLKEFREKKGLSLQEFAKELGLSEILYAQYEDGECPIPDLIKSKLARLGVNIHWLITGESTMFCNANTHGIQSTDDSNTILLPILPRIIPEITTEESWENLNFDIYNKIAIPKNIFHQSIASTEIFGLEVQGNSMEKEHLCNGDIAIIENIFFIGDGIYAFSYNHEVYIKQLQFNPFTKRMIISSANDNYQSFEEDSEKLIILGKLIGWLHLHSY